MGTIYTVPDVTVAGIDSTVMVAADALGTKTTMTVPEKGVIETLKLTDLANQDAPIDILLFKADITSGTNGEAYDMADGDAANYIGHIEVTNADYSSLSDNSVAVVKNVGLAYDCPSGVITFQCVVRSAPTYVAAGDLVIAPIIWVP